MDDWNMFADWAVKAAIAGLCSYGVHILSGIKKSIGELNVQVGQIIERTGTHSKEIERIDARLMWLERSHRDL